MFFKNNYNNVIVKLLIFVEMLKILFLSLLKILYWNGFFDGFKDNIFDVFVSVNGLMVVLL